MTNQDTGSILYVVATFGEKDNAVCIRRGWVVAAFTIVVLSGMMSYSPAQSGDLQRNTPTPAPSGTPAAPAPLFGPESGAGKYPVTVIETGASARDFTLNLRFFVPYTRVEGNWLLAIVFRTRGREANAGYALGISQNADYAFSFLRPGNQTILDTGTLPSLINVKDSPNDLVLRVEGEVADLTINGEEAASLRLFDAFDSGPTPPNDIVIVMSGNVRGESMRYEALSLTLPEAVSETEGASLPCVITTRRATPLRTAPDEFAPRIASIPANVTLEGLAATPSGFWFKVRYGGQEGWVFLRTAEPGNGCANLPIERE
jgi:hypothetical protein